MTSSDRALLTLLKSWNLRTICAQQDDLRALLTGSGRATWHRCQALSRSFHWIVDACDSSLSQTALGVVWLNVPSCTIHTGLMTWALAKDRRQTRASHCNLFSVSLRCCGSLQFSAFCSPKWEHQISSGPCFQAQALLLVVQELARAMGVHSFAKTLVAVVADGWIES